MKIVIINALILFLAATLTAMIGYSTAPDATLDNLDPSLTIIAPNGGENLYGGENTSITWTATDWRIPLAAVQIWFSSTGGDSYQLVVGGADNTGSYSWQIPELETNAALIKIRVTDSMGNYSEQVSASVFSISHTPPAVQLGCCSSKTDEQISKSITIWTIAWSSFLVSTIKNSIQRR